VNSSEYRRMTRVGKSIEWAVETNDAHGDIIDSDYYRTESDALHAARQALTDDCVAWVDVASVERVGSESEGEIDRTYDYRVRLHVDGRSESLTTSPDGLTPIAGVVAGTQVIHVTPDSRKDDLSTSEEGAT
jgi:hypothetical protein